MSTGDELVTDGSPLAPGQIRETNQTMLAPLLTAAGCAVRTFGVVPDDEATLERTLREAAESSDAIVTSGGVSMGDYDVVKAVLGRIAEMRWMQVAIKPAKPFAFGTIDGVPVFGLPGNPVSSLVSFEMLARPALRQMMGHARTVPPDRSRRSPTAGCAAARTARSTSSASSPRSATTAGCTSSRSPPRAAISWRRRRWPTPWRSSTTATASPPAATSPPSS